MSIGEEFGLPYGKIATGQVVAGLKKLGFDYVFDVNFGADITTIIEAKELLERLAKNKNGNNSGISPLFPLRRSLSAEDCDEETRNSPESSAERLQRSKSEEILNLCYSTRITNFIKNVKAL